MPHCYLHQTFFNFDLTLNNYTSTSSLLTLPQCHHRPCLVLHIPLYYYSDPPPHYIHHTFFTSDSTHYTTYATPFNHWPTPLLPYLIYIWHQFTTNNALFTSDPTHNLCHTPSISDSTPVLSTTVYHAFSPLIPHSHYLHHNHFDSDPAHNSTYATPSSFVALPQYYRYPTLFTSSICWYCKSFKNALVFFIIYSFIFTMLLKVNYEVNRRIVRRKEISFIQSFLVVFVES